MTVVETTKTPTTHYGFAHVARMEWVKLRSLRSTWWTLAVTIAAAIGIAVTVGLKTKSATGDITNNILGGVAPGLLLTGVLGVLVMTNEYTSGLIRSTLTATPKRSLVLAAKAAVFGVVSLAVGETGSFTSFLAGRLAVPRAITSPALSQPGVLRAVILTGAGYCLIGLLGVGIGAIVRHTAGAIAGLVGGVYVAVTRIMETPQSRSLKFPTL